MKFFCNDIVGIKKNKRKTQPKKRFRFVCGLLPCWAHNLGRRRISESVRCPSESSNRRGAAFAYFFFFFLGRERGWPTGPPVVSSQPIVGLPKGPVRDLAHSSIWKPICSNLIPLTVLRNMNRAAPQRDWNIHPSLVNFSYFSPLPR